MARFETGKALLAAGAGRDQVEAFFHELLDQGFNFHPDSAGRDYVNADGKDSFTGEEADEYDRLMERSFTVCQYFDVDIYEIGVEKFEAILTAGQAEE
jgi:hypothetical protein